MSQAKFSGLVKNTALVISSTVFLLTSVNATPLNLKSLRIDEQLNESKANRFATVAMIYQPDCSWCKKQGGILEVAFKQCQSSLNIALVGAKGDKRALKKELRHYHKDIPAFIADTQFLRSIGGFNASPTTVIYDQQGQVIAKQRGFISKEKLANALAIISDGQCKT